MRFKFRDLVENLAANHCTNYEQLTIEQKREIVAALIREYDDYSLLVDCESNSTKSELQLLVAELIETNCSTDSVFKFYEKILDIFVTNTKAYFAEQITDALEEAHSRIYRTQHWWQEHIDADIRDRVNALKGN
jgi:arginine/lysine/ornithine decarboxylase